MRKYKKVLLIPRCVLTRGLDCKSTLDSSEAMEIMKVISDCKSAIIQLPCPHLMSIIENEKRMANHLQQLNEFSENNLVNTKFYFRILTPVIKEIEECVKQGCQVFGLIGVKGSPSCSVKTLRGQAEGEFVKVLINKLKERSIKVEAINI